MAHIMAKKGSQDNIVTYEHYCDTMEDMAKIEPEYITLGSTCVVVEGDSGELEAYIAKSDKTWKPV